MLSILGSLESQPQETWREVAWASSSLAQLHQPPPNALITSRKFPSIPGINLYQAHVPKALQAGKGLLG